MMVNTKASVRPIAIPWAGHPSDDVDLNWFRLGYLVHDVSRMRRTLYDQHLKSLGITRSQWWVLANISRQPRHGVVSSTLARDIDVCKVTLSGIIDRLEIAGYVYRWPDKKDKRAKRIYITESGYQLIDEMRTIIDCSGVSDGAACATVTTPEIARALGRTDLVTIKPLQITTSSGRETQMSDWDGSYVPNTRNAAKRAHAEAGITDSKSQLSLTEVHDCFSITERVTMEDLGLSEDGQAGRDVLDSKFDRDGAIPCQIDGGLKCFGHPIGASGPRMAYEIYTQPLGRAGARQLSNPSIGLMHKLAGVPYQGAAAISILGLL
jgi:DNA-binding MarR family transcriptional regulator